jgi:uncharacterized integral membrane protein
VADTTAHDHRTHDHTTSETMHDVGRTIRVIVIAALVVAVVLVALDNRSDVRLGYVFGDADAPVWLAIVGAAVAGMIVGWVARHRPRN